MNDWLHRLASKRLTIAGFLLLAAGTLMGDELAVPTGAIVGPLALLALNLATGIFLRPSLRRGGLGLFHVMLLLLLALAAWGRLTHFDGRVEVTQGALLDPAQIQVTGAGPSHGDRWQHLAFAQGGWEVDYVPGPRRGHTRSEVWLPGESAPRVVGDDTPLVLDGYRFYTTSNKGYALLLTWQTQGSAPIRGSLHMPSYPALAHQQENRWTAPSGRELSLWLRLDRTVPERESWTLRADDVPSVLVVEAAGQRRELRRGEQIEVEGALLRYEGLTGWMGYRIFYDVTLVPMLAVSLIAVLGLAWHLWGRSARLLPLGQGAAA